MDLSGLLSTLQSSGTISQIGNAISGQKDTSQLQKLVSFGVPTLMQAMGSNAKTTEGANALSQALKQHAGHNVQDMLGNITQVDSKDGLKILGHLLGQKQDTVTGTLSEKTGLNTSQVTQGLSVLAPILMSFLGSKGGNNKNLSASILSMLSGLGDGNSKMQGTLGIASMLFNKNTNDSVVDNIGGMIGGMFKKKK